MRRLRWAVIALLLIALLVLLGSRFVVQVPSVIGGQAGIAISDLEDIGLRVKAVSTGPKAVADVEGIEGQSPSPGSWLLKGMLVTLRTAPDQESVIVPDLIGLVEDGALAELHATGLIGPAFTGGVTIGSEEGVSASVVVSQTPPAGTRVPWGSRIEVDSKFPHMQARGSTEATTWASVKAIHGVIYLRNGSVKACEPCHSPDTCVSKACHDSEAYRAIARRYRAQQR